MLNFKNCFENNLYETNKNELLRYAANVNSLDWEEAYWLGKCLYELSNENNIDDLVIDCFVSSMHKGLNITNNESYFFDAAQILSRLYIRRNDYLRATNYLMDLAERMDPVPDWVNIYYIMSQVLTDTIFRHAEDPVFLFRRLDSISPENYVQRAKVYQIFLKRLYDIENSGTTRKLNIEQFEGLREKYIGLYLDEIKYTVEDDSLDENEFDEQIEDNTDNQYIEEIEILKKKITELQDENKIKNETIDELNRKVKDREAALVNIRIGINDSNNEEDYDHSSGGLINLRRNEKILLIGDLSAKVKDIVGISKMFGIKEENLEIVSDYDKITNFGNRITPGKYRAIIIGPTPHSVKDNDGSSSLAQRILSNPVDYPYAVRCEDERGNLRISKTSYKKALEYISKMMDVI